MSRDAALRAEERLVAVLRETERWVVAVSGGVDSVTLASVAHRAGLAVAPRMIHAVSPAVPSTAGPRLAAHAATEGWAFQTVGAGELDDPNYRANPYDRCYFCKSALYRTMLQRLSDVAERGWTLASGANLDDLGEHRPGLRAAAEHGVRHPLIEAGIDKPLIRAIARNHGLSGFSELPAQPCLASRIETGIAIDPAALRFVDMLEAQLSALAGDGVTLRARLRRSGVEVELGALPEAAAGLTPDLDRIARLACAAAGRTYAGLRPYSRGSAFVKDPQT